MDTQALNRWFLSEKRDLPWRNNASAYAVWVSEVMLQQTQVSVVIPYFLKWMELFPTVEALASAPLDLVIKTWEGLGYYSRARNLCTGAQMVMEHFNGRIPNNREDLAKIKGLGPYTIGALLSFGFKQRAAAVDGNVIRVFSRFFGIEEDVGKSLTQKKIWGLAEKHLPDNDPWITAEAWIELGAKICTKNPQCSSCPLKDTCKAHLQGDPKRYPIKTAKEPTQKLYRIVAVISHGNEVLIARAEKGKIHSDLHYFPYLQTTEELYFDTEAKLFLDSHFGIQTELIAPLKEAKHSFTKYRCHLRPFHMRLRHKKEFPGFSWKSADALTSLAFSAGHRDILKNVLCKEG